MPPQHPRADRGHATCPGPVWYAAGQAEAPPAPGNISTLHFHLSCWGLQCALRVCISYVEGFNKNLRSETAIVWDQRELY